MQHEELAKAALRFPPLNLGVTGNVYRCAAHLTDGLFLPCVALLSSKPTVDSAIRRFAEVKADEKLPQRMRRGGTYREVVQYYVTCGGRIDTTQIKSIEESDFALSPERLAEINDVETRMSWTQFVVVMRDGAEFSFGTAHHVEFFDMPPGYTARDVRRLLLHESRGNPVYRERPFFNCYIDAAI